MKKAIITGITGQDGSYLAEFLSSKGYEVHGFVRRLAAEDPKLRYSRIWHIKDKLKLHSANIENYARMLELFDEIQPDECYHLAAQSFVHESFEDSFTTLQININGTHNILAAIQRKCPSCKFYFAATSEMFGKVLETPQTEKTPFYPRSPYAVSKVTGFDLTRNYRESYGLFACSGILFNHESPRRGYEFVTRKITKAVADIKNKEINVLVLGNMDSKRDWGYAKDYVEGMWMMLQQDKPDDYVLATGETHSVKEFVDAAFASVDLQYQLVDLHDLNMEEADKRVEDLKQKGGIYVVQHPRFYRPAEVELLLGDPSKAKQVLGWEPKVKFAELLKMMVEADLK